MAQLLERINAKLAVAQDEFLTGELLAKKAAYLGRIGDTEQARAIVQQVRQRFNDGRSGRVTCFVQIAEGILLHNAFQSTAALDKFSRADLLAQAIREPDLIGICSVWKAFVDFDLSRFESMQRSLLLVNDLGLEEDHAVQSRRAVTLMTAAILLGERRVAQHWFHVGHRHAVAEGDLACIDALLFNRAVFGLARQRIAWCSGAFDPSWARAIRGELESARNLQNMAGITTMQDHVDLCLARLDLLDGAASTGNRKPAQFSSLDKFSRKHVNELALHLDNLFESWMTQSLGREQLKAGLLEADWEQLTGLDPDERLVALTIHSRLVEALGVQAEVDSRLRELEETRDAYMKYEATLRNALAPWLYESRSTNPGAAEEQP